MSLSINALNATFSNAAPPARFSVQDRAGRLVAVLDILSADGALLSRVEQEADWLMQGDEERTLAFARASAAFASDEIRGNEFDGWNLDDVLIQGVLEMTSLRTEAEFRRVLGDPTLRLEARAISELADLVDDTVRVQLTPADAVLLYTCRSWDSTLSEAARAVQEAVARQAPAIDAALVVVVESWADDVDPMDDERRADVLITGTSRLLLDRVPDALRTRLVRAADRLHRPATDDDLRRAGFEPG